MRLLLIITLVFLQACSSRYDAKYSKDTYGALSAPTVYTVKKGDTLFSIAWRFGLEQSAIQRQNRLSDPNKIFVGQKLHLHPDGNNVVSTTTTGNNKKSSTGKTTAKKKTTTTASASKTYSKGSWVWPMNGKVARRFSPGSIGGNGIRITGKPNQTVNAADSGTVAYKGNGLNGYGNVVIIKHSGGLLSAYGFLSKTYVKEGQKITKRQKIGTVGYAADRRLMLHFEVRSKGKPVNPINYIGSSYHF